MANVYTTSAIILEELPVTIPASLTTEKINGYIWDASRYVDARLPNYAGFPDISADPKTPAVIEKITRLLAAHDCMVFMGEMRGDAHAGSELRDIAEKMLDDLCPGGGSTPRAYIDPSEYDYNQMSKLEQIRLTVSSAPRSLYRTDLKRRDDPGSAGDS